MTGGSGQQCCYGRDGLLITGVPGGGTVDLISPDVSPVGHFVQDVLPFLLCCKAGIFSDCDEYYEHRPSDPGFDYSPPPPPGIIIYTCSYYAIMYCACIQCHVHYII